MMNYEKLSFTNLLHKNPLKWQHIMNIEIFFKIFYISLSNYLTSLTEVVSMVVTVGRKCMKKYIGIKDITDKENLYLCMHTCSKKQDINYFKKYRSEQIAQSGRSMIEMLGVLAIIGVLSIGGIAGYRRAINKYRANEIMRTASMMVVMMQTDFSDEGSCIQLSNSEFPKKPGGIGADITVNSEIEPPSVYIQAPDEVCDVINDMATNGSFYIDGCSSEESEQMNCDNE